MFLTQPKHNMTSTNLAIRYDFVRQLFTLPPFDSRLRIHIRHRSPPPGWLVAYSHARMPRFIHAAHDAGWLQWNGLARSQIWGEHEQFQHNQHNMKFNSALYHLMGMGKSSQTRRFLDHLAGL